MAGYIDLLCFAVGYGSSMAWNYNSGVPMHRGHPRNLAVGFAVGIGGYLIRKKREDMARVKLFELEEYVRSHPADFPPVERKKWGEVFQTWKSPFRPDTD